MEIKSGLLANIFLGSEVLPTAGTYALKTRVGNKICQWFVLLRRRKEVSCHVLSHISVLHKQSHLIEPVRQRHVLDILRSP